MSHFFIKTIIYFVWEHGLKLEQELQVKLQAFTNFCCQIYNIHWQIQTYLKSVFEIIQKIQLTKLLSALAFNIGMLAGNNHHLTGSVKIIYIIARVI